MQHGQPHAVLPIGLHVPDTGTPPVVVVAPAIHFRLTRYGNAVHVCTEHLASIDQQPRMADAVMIVRQLRVVVSPQGKAYPAPCGKVPFDAPCRTLLLGVWLSEAESLLAAAAVEDTFTLHGNSHEGMGLRCYGVSNDVCQECQRVAHSPSLRIVNLQVEMRTRGMSGIAADGDEVAGTDGKLRFREVQRKCIL